jgi:hypothetical protein
MLKDPRAMSSRFRTNPPPKTPAVVESSLQVQLPCAEDLSAQVPPLPSRQRGWEKQAPADTGPVLIMGYGLQSEIRQRRCRARSASADRAVQSARSCSGSPASARGPRTPARAGHSASFRAPARRRRAPPRRGRAASGRPGRASAAWAAQAAGGERSPGWLADASWPLRIWRAAWPVPVRLGATGPGLQPGYSPRLETRVAWSAKAISTTPMK